MVQFKEVAYQIKETCFPVVLKDEFKTCYIELKKRCCTALFACPRCIKKVCLSLKKTGPRAYRPDAAGGGGAQFKDLAYQIKGTCFPG